MSSLKVKSILVTQPKPETDKSPYFDLSKKFSVKIDFRPFIHVEPIPAANFRSTAYYLQKFVVYRKRKIFFGKQTINDLMDLIKKHKKEKFLVPCTDIHKQEIFETLDSHSIDYTKAVIYKTVASDLSDLAEVNYDVLVFFSPSGITSLFKNFPKFKQNNTRIAAFGPTTAQAVTDAGLRLDIQAPVPAAPSMTMALEQYIKKNNK